MRISEIPEGKTIHILLRYTEGKGEHTVPAPGTIALHEEIIKKYGYVWIGKWGRAVKGDFVIRTLMEQINAGVHTYVFLARYEAKAYLVHSCELVSIATHVDDDNLIPLYYRDRKTSINTWFKVRDITQVNPDILDELIGPSNGMSISQTLKKNMSSFLYVLFGTRQTVEDFR